MKKSAMARLQTRNLKVDTYDRIMLLLMMVVIMVVMMTISMMMVMICGDNYDRPWDVDPVPAAREDEDHAAVAEQGEQEDDPDSTTESPPEDEYVGDDHDHVDDNEE